MIYRAYFGMEFNPFDKVNSQKCPFESQDFKEATSRLEHLKDIRGIGLFTGLSGMGKTYTLKQFVDKLNPNLYKVVYIPLSTVTVLEFYKAFAYGLGIEPAQRKIDIFKQIQECIEALSTAKRITPTIILDERTIFKNRNIK